MRLVYTDMAHPALRVLSRVLPALAVYISLWGCLSSMAGLYTTGYVSLLAGCGLCICLSLPERQKGEKSYWIYVAVGVLLTGITAFVFSDSLLDGVGGYINRLFAASEARQSYIYDRMPVSSAYGPEDIQRALVPVGILTGILCALLCRYLNALGSCVPLVGVCLLAAYLGISPSTLWLCALCFSALLGFLLQGVGLRSAVRILFLLPAACVALIVYLVFPGESVQLSAWDEAMRDRLSDNTVAYVETLPEDVPDAVDADEGVHGEQENLRPFYEIGDTGADTGGDSLFERPLPWLLLLAIALTALLLYGPAVIRDRQKKRQAENRACLSETDNAVCIRDSFLYAMRYLKAGGLVLENKPYSACGEAVERAFDASLRAAYESVLPLWQEASYSTHTMDDVQRQAMIEFVHLVQETVWQRLNRRQRLRLTYVEAL